MVVRPKEYEWFGFVLLCVSCNAFIEYANAGSTGTKMPRTSWKQMAHYPIAIPPKNVADQFNRDIEPMSEMIISFVHEYKRLSLLREILLPKLISGELRIASVERIEV